MDRIYLDYAATTPVRPEVRNAMLPFLDTEFGNPSTVYSYGIEASEAVEKARVQVARLIHASPSEIIFTSGGTESNNLAIKGVAYALKAKGRHIITSAVEHHSVTGPCHTLERYGFEITYLPVDEHGFTDPECVRHAIRPDTVLASVMHANNEIGTIQPVSEIGQIARENGICFHTDAIQTQGHVPVDVNELGVDLLSMSAHKIYGPKGTGALYVRTGTPLEPLIDGGEQENQHRAGTENVAGIAGFGVAAELAASDMEQEAVRLSALRDTLVARLIDVIPDIYLNGHPKLRLPGNVNFSIDFIEGESVCLNLDMEGICAATGSACTTHNVEPSHVILALGRPRRLAHGSVRFSLGKWTTEGDINRVLDVLPGVVNRLRQMSPYYRQQ